MPETKPGGPGPEKTDAGAEVPPGSEDSETDESLLKSALDSKRNEWLAYADQKAERKSTALGLSKDLVMKFEQISVDQSYKHGLFHINQFVEVPGMYGEQGRENVLTTFKDETLPDEYETLTENGLLKFGLERHHFAWEKDLGVHRPLAARIVNLLAIKSGGLSEYFTAVADCYEGSRLPKMEDYLDRQTSLRGSKVAEIGGHELDTLAKYGIEAKSQSGGVEGVEKISGGEMSEEDRVTLPSYQKWFRDNYYDVSGGRALIDPGSGFEKEGYTREYAAHELISVFYNITQKDGFICLQGAEYRYLPLPDGGLPQRIFWEFLAKKGIELVYRAGVNEGDLDYGSGHGTVIYRKTSDETIDEAEFEGIQRDVDRLDSVLKTATRSKADTWELGNAAKKTIEIFRSLMAKGILKDSDQALTILRESSKASEFIVRREYLDRAASLIEGETEQE